MTTSLSREGVVADEGGVQKLTPEQRVIDVLYQERNDIEHYLFNRDLYRDELEEIAREILNTQQQAE